MQFDIRSYDPASFEELLSLYRSAGWVHYTQNPAMLREAYANSLCALAAYREGALAGAVRAVGDGASILYVQDLLVRPDCRRQGIGGALLRAMLARYPQVYQKVLLTDDREDTVKFYQSLGFERAARFGCTAFLYGGRGC